MNRKAILVGLLIILVLSVIPTSAQTTQFTHQGALIIADGDYEFEFRLFDSPTAGAGAQQGATLQKLFPNAVHVTNNAFTVSLDFGDAVFTGAELYLETSWRPVGGSFTALSPREKLTAVYANRSLSAATADTAANATQLGGLPVSGFILNTVTPQAGTNFNVSGDGSAGGTLSGNIVNAGTQFSINGARILSTQGTHNLFAGINAGVSNTTGIQNAFFGGNVGKANTTGRNNSFFGNEAGWNNTEGIANSFFGAEAGGLNIYGDANSFFGNGAGYWNSTGNYNSFFGLYTGTSNRSGNFNSVFGSHANLTDGLSNATAIGAKALVGQSNSLVLGAISGVNGATANTFVGIGVIAPQQTLHVHGSEVLSTGPSSGFKFRNRDSSSSSDDWVWYSDANIARFWRAGVGDLLGVTPGGAVGIGTTAPAARLHVSGSGVIRARVNSDSNAGLALTLNNQPKWSVATVNGGQFQIFNDAIGQNAVFIDSASNNVGIGVTTPGFKLHVIDSSNLGLRVQTNSAGGAVASFGSFGDFLIDSPGIAGGRFIVRQNGSVGIGTSTPADLLHIAGGFLRLSLPAGGGVFPLCLNPANQISICGSSLRYKTNLAPFRGGLDLVDRLQPITFNWKANGAADIGLGAEDVAEVEPLLVTRNEKGEIEGVKYDRIAVVLLNAIKEQQRQIKDQQEQNQRQTEQIERQRQEIESLKRLACLSQPKADICNTSNGSTSKFSAVSQ
ncbi:MAG TPA: tail fiber domain-containing protein [Blastocatellia bacterium]|nr:tail fiber domain-containing protein [Blastocatellia bacterium]